MNFDFSDDQKMLKDQARKFLTEKCPTKAVRKILESDEPYDKALWKQIGEMGWLGTAIPEEYGGLGLGHLELCVIAEELGRAIAPVPFSSTVYLATEAIMLAGSEAQKKKYLPKLAAGELIGTFALAEGAQPPSPKTVKASFKSGKLDGIKSPVPDGDVADFAVVLVRSGEGQGERALSLAIVDLKAAGVTRRTVKTVDPSRSQAEITFKGAAAEALGAQGEGWDLTRRILDRAAILMAFEQVGGADTCLAMAKDYALNRYAFGRQIGSFQAIKHKLADMYVLNELARSNAYFGAWALSTNAPDLPEAAAGARISATDAFHNAAQENIQTHGGMGFTWELDCHLFYRRSKTLSLALGASRVWKDRLINHLEKKNVA
ncbi:MAG: acyl-CoA/acyl-ACP dehydrogenase [Alphaproteobacteria bacterium]|nr:acyl-CoA/acyl-ACP dehydrogenase [Alphaproteobacteria bacterium]